MTAVEAMIYCLGFIDVEPEDGEYRSATAYDCNNEAHWFAWSAAYGKLAKPRICSETPEPFAREHEPYTTSRHAKTQAN